MKPFEEMTIQEKLDFCNQRSANRAAGRPLDAPPAAPTRSADELEADDRKLEVAEAREADKQMRTLGFRVLNTSQPRHAKYITPGFPDRLYTHRARGLAIWYEAKKRKGGRQRPAQHEFQLDCEAVPGGWPYVVGHARVLFEWLVARGIAEWDASGNLVTPPSEARRSA